MTPSGPTDSEHAGIVAVVPVKGLDRGKSRLAGHLTLVERAQLIECLLGRVLEAIRGSRVVSHCLVISSDPSIRRAVEDSGAMLVSEERSRGPDGHNQALEQARRAAHSWHPSALLVLAADLPLISVSDVQEIARLGAADQTLVIAPDRGGTGTNGIFMRPPDLASFQFGLGSFQKHVDAAMARGCRLEIYRGTGTAFDLDVPTDFEEIAALNLSDVGRRTQSRV